MKLEDKLIILPESSLSSYVVIDHVHTTSDSFSCRHKNLSEIMPALFGMILHETILLFFLFAFIRSTEECILMRVVNIFKVVVRKGVRKNAPGKKAPGKNPLRKSPTKIYPRKYGPQENCPLESCPPEKCPLGKLPPGKLTPEKLFY